MSSQAQWGRKPLGGPIPTGCQKGLFFTLSLETHDFLSSSIWGLGLRSYEREPYGTGENGPSGIPDARNEELGQVPTALFSSARFLTRPTLEPRCNPGRRISSHPYCCGATIANRGGDEAFGKPWGRLAGPLADRNIAWRPPVSQAADRSGPSRCV